MKNVEDKSRDMGLKTLKCSKYHSLLLSRTVSDKFWRQWRKKEISMILIDLLIDGILMYSRKYFMHFQDEKKINNI